MTNEQIKWAAMDYVATHEHDNGQIFTSAACKVDHQNYDFVDVQVWVGVPHKWLEEWEKKNPNEKGEA